MDYKFTFEDGSEAIAHHGVKGMKWGVRNAETLAKYGLKNANSAGGGGGVPLDEESEIEKVTDKIDKTVEAKKAAEDAKEWLNKKHKRFIKIGKIRIPLGESPSFSATSVVFHEVDRVLGKNRKANDGTVSKAIGNVKDEASVAYVKTKVNKRKNANGPMPTASRRVSDAVYAVKAGRK